MNLRPDLAVIAARVQPATRALDIGCGDGALMAALPAQIAHAQQQEPVRHEQFAARIAELGTRIRALAPRVLALGVEHAVEKRGGGLHLLGGCVLRLRIRFGEGLTV